MATGSSSRNHRVRIPTARIATGEMLGATRARGGADSWVLIYGAKTEDLTRRHVLAADRDTYDIGRSSQSQIIVDSSAASRRHARLHRIREQWWLKDLESLNGTYVNDRRIDRVRLAHGDRVQIGDFFFKHLAGDDVEAAYAEAIRSALVTDGLTQAANERAFRESLRSALARAEGANAETASLVMCDLDHFKSVNDTHGHPAGDRVLREFVRIVKSACRDDSVVVARVGGEEFALLVPGRGVDAAALVAERVRQAVEAHAFEAPKGELALTCSFGVTEMTKHDDEKRWFARADALLYEAKRAGRNRVCR
jgi:diguanylate cyclase (GGDEF)-like protein